MALMQVAAKVKQYIASHPDEQADMALRRATQPLGRVATRRGDIHEQRPQIGPAAVQP
jgi:hypothetical protein